jgi:site-specific recombinase XerD
MRWSFCMSKSLGNPSAHSASLLAPNGPSGFPWFWTRAEVNCLLDAFTGTYRLMAGLLYGSGLRLMECVRLRAKDVDFAHNQIMVRDGKGQKDRVTVLPQRFQPLLRAHLACVKE